MQAQNSSKALDQASPHLGDTTSHGQVASESAPGDVAHRKVEFDLQFFGGDYSRVGDYVYIPLVYVDQHPSIEAAFTAFTGHNARHIVCTHDDELVTADGAPYDDGSDGQDDASEAVRPRMPL